MNRHCCFCGAKAPKSIGGSGWLSFRPDNDPTHYGCPEHKDQVTTRHALEWRAGRIGCRISPDPSWTQSNGK